MKTACNKTSVGVILKNEGKILFIERKKFPFGLACPAGHVEDGERYEDAAAREAKEEVGLVVSELQCVFEGRLNFPCRRGSDFHFWKVYTAEHQGIINAAEKEVAGFVWLDKKEIQEKIKDDKIEKVWIEIFRKTNTIG